MYAEFFDVIRSPGVPDRVGVANKLELYRNFAEDEKVTVLKLFCRDSARLLSRKTCWKVVCMLFVTGNTITIHLHQTSLVPSNHFCGGHFHAGTLDNVTKTCEPSLNVVDHFTFVPVKKSKDDLVFVLQNDSFSAIFLATSVHSLKRLHSNRVL